MTTTALDMSLDDIIKNNRKSNSRGRPPRFSGGAGPFRRFSNRAANRTAPYSKPPVQAPDTIWQHDMFTETAPPSAAYPPRASSIETGTKLYISNLDYGVSTEDIKELFSEAGDLKRCSVHYDRSGRSEGTAEVVFARREDAVAAFKRYNNVQLDGKPMKIEIVGTNLATRPAAPLSTNDMYLNHGTPRSNPGRGGAAGRPRGGGRGARSGGRGRGRAHDEKISAEDLDADLEKYHSEAM